MIRKLKSGEYRLYSRKLDPKTHKRRISGRSRPARRPKSMSARCNISSTTNRSAEPDGRPRSKSELSVFLELKGRRLAMTQFRKKKSLSREEDYRDYQDRDAREGWPYSDESALGSTEPENREYGTTPANFDEDTPLA